MRLFDKKTLLFIEPCVSSQLLVLKAKEKRYDAFVIASPSGQQILPDEVINASTSFFQVNTNDESAVFDLVKKIAQKFFIDAVILGAENYVPLATKVATYLNKPGLTSDEALKSFFPSSWN